MASTWPAGVANPDPLEAALERASAAGEWTLVATLAAELHARRLASADVIPIGRGRRAK